MMRIPKTKQYSYHIKTIDSHTMGEATRIVYDGFPELKGSTMMEKKNDLIENYDFLRKSLMLEPRGHRDMFGALLTKPVHKEAHYGVIFMESLGCLNMCGHGSIGTASMLVETGMVEVTEPYTDVVLDAPSGLIRTRVHVVDGEAVEVSILNVPSFLYKEDLIIDTEKYGEITFDISFGGSFFALVNAEKLSLDLTLANISDITNLGMELLTKINKSYEIKHPYLDITTVDLVEFYEHTRTPGADMKNCVIFGDAQADRSPCGTGTSAKLAMMYAKNEIGLHEEFAYESVIGSIFRGEAVQEIEISDIKGIIPQITGSAYITGVNEWIIDEQDPLRFGFLLGTMSNTKESNRNKIVCAAWELFREKGFSQTTVEEILKKSHVDFEIFQQYFASKEDLEHTLGDYFDEQYSQLMISMTPSMSQYEKLIYLNQKLFQLIEQQVPIDLLTHNYVRMPEERHELLNKNRFYYKLIPKLIADGQESGEFNSEESAEMIAETYFSLERGLIYDWCVTKGRDSLIEKSKKILPLYLGHILTNQEVLLSEES